MHLAKTRKRPKYRATSHEMKNFWYQSIDLFKIYRLRDTREPESAIGGGKKEKMQKLVCRALQPIWAPWWKNHEKDPFSKDFGRFLKRSARNPHKGGVTRPSWGVTKPNTIRPHLPAIENPLKMYEIQQIWAKPRISSDLMPNLPFDAQWHN